MILTPNYSLIVWEGADTFNPADLQSNWEAIDTELAAPKAAKNAQLLSALPGSPANGEMVTLTAANGGFSAGTTAIYNTTLGIWRAIHTEIRADLPVSNLYDGRTVYLTANNGGYLIGDTVRYHTSATAGWRRIGSVGKAVGHSVSADTIANLNTAAGGTPFDGQVGKLRLGSTPYQFVSLSFDATYNKWVSNTTRIFTTEDTQGLSWNGTSYADVAGSAPNLRGFIQNFKTLYDAGLRPQFRVVYVLRLSVASGTGTAGLKLYEFSDGDSAGASIQTTESHEATVTTNVGVLRVVDWAAPTISAPAEEHAFIAIRSKHSTGGASISVDNAAIDLRWVSA